LVVGATTVVNAESSRGFNGVKKPLVSRKVDDLANIVAGRARREIVDGDF
jgi:hypothetical protein